MDDRVYIVPQRRGNPKHKTMKRTKPFVMVCIAGLLKSYGPKGKFSSYLGEKAPGSTPIISAPGIVSLVLHHEFSCTFSPGGTWGDALPLDELINRRENAFAPCDSPDKEFLSYSNDGDIDWTDNPFRKDLKNQTIYT